MTTAAALAFLAAVRERADLRDAVAGLPPGLEPLVALAVAEGYSVALADLDAAFRIDWGARWLHYQRQRPWQET